MDYLLTVGRATDSEVERGGNSYEAEDESAAVQNSDDGVAQARHFCLERKEVMRAKEKGVVMSFVLNFFHAKSENQLETVI